MLLGLSGVTALGIVASPWIMHAFGYGDLAIGLARVLFPIVVLLGLTGIVVGILNTYEHFTVPALAPVVWNLAIIAGLFIGVPPCRRDRREALRLRGRDRRRDAHPTAPAAPWLRGRDGQLQVVLDWRDPAVRRTFVLMLPITLGLGLINLNALIDTFFAARLIDRYQAPSAINAAFRLYMLPQGMFAVAVATVLFPALAKLASRGDMDGFRRTTASGVRQVAFLLIPASASRRSWRSPSQGLSTSAATSPRRRRRSWPRRSRPSRSASSSTA